MDGGLWGTKETVESLNRTSAETLAAGEKQRWIVFFLYRGPPCTARTVRAWWTAVEPTRPCQWMALPHGARGGLTSHSDVRQLGRVVWWRTRRGSEDRGRRMREAKKCKCSAPHDEAAKAFGVGFQAEVQVGQFSYDVLC